MFDKIGSSNKVQMSPPGLIDFHGKGVPNQLKPMNNMAHNQSFDAIPVHN